MIFFNINCNLKIKNIGTMEEIIEFLKQLYGDAPQGALILDADGLIIWTNDTVTKTLKRNLVGENGPTFLRQYNDNEISWPPNTKVINRRYIIGELMEMVSRQIPNSDHYLVTVHALDGENGIKTIMEKKISNNIASQAHDLKTPLNAVIGFSQLVISSLSEDLTPDTLKSVQEYMGIILNSGKQLSVRVENMLVFNKLENNLVKPKISKIDMLEFTQNIVEKYSFRLQKSGIKIYREPLNLKCSIIYADRDFLNRAVENMILNAIEAIEANKNTDKKKEIKISFGKKDDGNVAIVVINPGKISEENLHKIFKGSRFTTKENGNGLGTKIIQLVAQMHGGSASMQCENNKISVGINFPDATKN